MEFLFSLYLQIKIKKYNDLTTQLFNYSHSAKIQIPDLLVIISFLNYLQQYLAQIYMVKNRIVLTKQSQDFLLSNFKVKKQIFYKTRSKRIGYKLKKYYFKRKIFRYWFSKYKLSRYKYLYSLGNKHNFSKTFLYKFPFYDLRQVKFKRYKIMRNKWKKIKQTKKSLLIKFFFKKNLKLKKTRLPSLYFYFLQITRRSISNNFFLTNSFWLLRFLTIFIEKYTQNKIKWLIFSPQFFINCTLSLEFKKYFSKILVNSKINYLNKLFGGELYLAAYTLLFTKSLTILLVWVIAYLKTLQVKRYKRILLLISLFLKLLIIFGKQFNLLLGFRFSVKGKLLGRGGTRKKKLLYKYGNFSVGTKSLQFSYKKFIIKTGGGIVSGNISLFF